jgi:hypothetical protein
LVPVFFVPVATIVFVPYSTGFTRGYCALPLRVEFSQEESSKSAPAWALYFHLTFYEALPMATS